MTNINTGKVITLYLRRITRAKSEWIDSTISIALALAEARSLHSSNVEFGNWCEANGFGLNVINTRDRAALILMGANPTRLRTVLEKTQSQSISLIFQKEWRKNYERR